MRFLILVMIANLEQSEITKDDVPELNYSRYSSISVLRNQTFKLLVKFFSFWLWALRFHTFRNAMMERNMTASVIAPYAALAFTLSTFWCSYCSRKTMSLWEKQSRASSGSEKSNVKKDEIPTRDYVPNDTINIVKHEVVPCYHQTDFTFGCFFLLCLQAEPLLDPTTTRPRSVAPHYASNAALFLAKNMHLPQLQLYITLCKRINAPERPKPHVRPP